jgi:hypothetical protein
MHTLLRYLVLLAIGIALAFACTWIIGWLAALVWDRETYRSITSSPVLSFSVLTIGMAALPVGIVALVAGTGISRRINARNPLHLTVLSAPWAVTVLAPPPGVAEPSAWLGIFLTDPHVLAVLFALPVGILVGTFFSSTRARAGAA